MNVMTVNEDNVEIFSKVLIEASEWLNSTGNLIGVYVIQWYDPLFWSELKENESGFLHKLAVSRKYSGKGYGTKLIQAAELLCKEQNIEWLRLNCGTFRPRLRNFYEGTGFKMLDRVFVDNRDQIRYIKKVV